MEEGGVGLSSHIIVHILWRMSPPAVRRSVWMSQSGQELSAS